MDVDDDIRQLALQGKRLRAIQALRERTGADFNQARDAVNALLPAAHRMRTRGVPVPLVGAALLAIIAAILFVVARTTDRLLPVFFRPIAVVLRPVVEPFAPLLLRPEVPPVVAVVVLAVGLPLAPRYRRPTRFRRGVIAIALALATFWPLQYLAASLELGYEEYQMFLRGVGLFISVCLLTGGIETIRRASNTPEADSWEFLN